LLRFNGNNGYANAPHSSIISTLLILFSNPTIAYWAEICKLKGLYVLRLIVRVLYFEIRKVLCVI